MSTELDKEFNYVQIQVRAKMEQALQLLKEAKELSLKESYWFANELDCQMSNIEDIVRDAFDREPSGWNTSGCFY